MRVALVMVLLSGTLLRADTLTLSSGETMTGEILEESADAYQLRMANDDYSISFVRVVEKTNVTAVVRDTPEQKAERAAFEALCRYRLQADREQTATQCERVIAALQQFLTDYPNAATAPWVRQMLATWETESANVAKGLVKFRNQWLTPQARAAAIQQMHIQAAQQGVGKLRQQIADWEAYRAQLTNALNRAERQLSEAEFTLSGLKDFTEPVYEYRPVGGYPQAIPYNNGYLLWSPPFWERYVSGEKVTVHPARPSAERRVRDYQASVNYYRSAIETADRTLITLRTNLQQTETALGALTK